MNKYNEMQYRRKKNFYRCQLGLWTLFNKPGYNIVWFFVVPVIFLFEYIKRVYITSLNIPSILSSAFFISEKIVTFLFPIILIISVIYAIGELIARNDENNLLLAFDEKDLKKGIPILTFKKKSNKVTVREFYSNIPLNRWNEKREEIAHVMNITIIGDIQYSKKNLIQFKAVFGKTPKENKVLYDDI